eukprot:gnl/TRDRNA2_/TRDRNA2_29210_c0_seq1.p1 gnl/TRDRNA2_/TRDRNA2_29210_c0~~gnl/TRDRNA2_/TRDRNA2_29210_c0_seq1.p1  ORF type:complete len:424 (-),score=90.35 gnl/TRDRNA2_/TRDRNA2_29210_c0_seq1:33-1304(-)
MHCCAVVNASLVGVDGAFDILIDGDGKISAINSAASSSSSCSTSAPPEGDSFVIDAEFSLVLPGFVDAHVHLDKALLNSRCCAETGAFSEALTKTLEAKRGFTVEDVATRASTVLEAAISFGTTKMRSHAEVDPEVGLRAVEALLALKAEYAWAIDLQVAAFAQERIVDGGALLREALSMGCDIVGSAPYCDSDPAQNIRLIFEIAREFDVNVDFHLDYHLGSEKPSYLQNVLEETVRNNYEHRVCLGHCTALSSLSPAALAETAERLVTAGVSVLALPASDVYMMARGDQQDRRRGVAPVDQLRHLGVAAAFATNNVQNLFTFTGDGDILKIATLTAQMLQLGSRRQHSDLLKMATTGAAEAISIRDHVLEVGRLADLVILHGAASATDAVAAPPVPRTVLKHGKLVAKTTHTVQLFPPKNR